MGLKALEERGQRMLYIDALWGLQDIHKGNQEAAWIAYEMLLKLDHRFMTAEDAAEADRHLDTPTEFGKLWHAEAMKLRLTG